MSCYNYSIQFFKTLEDVLKYIIVRLFQLHSIFMVGLLHNGWISTIRCNNVIYWAIVARIILTIWTAAIFCNDLSITNMNKCVQTPPLILKFLNHKQMKWHIYINFIIKQHQYDYYFLLDFILIGLFAYLHFAITISAFHYSDNFFETKTN